MGTGDDRRNAVKHVVSFSGGKDSTAMLLRMIDLILRLQIKEQGKTCSILPFFKKVWEEEEDGHIEEI